MNTIAQSVQNVDWNHKLYKNHDRDDENNEAVNSLPRVIHLDTLRFIAGLVRAEDILQRNVRIAAGIK